MTDQSSAGELEHFHQALLMRMKRNYERGINKDLSRQYWMGLFQRNVKEVLHDGLLETLQHVKANTGLLSQKDRLLSLWQEQINMLVEHALSHNRSSCAISNFTEEHKPSADYVAAVKDDGQRLLAEFAMALEQG